MSDPTEVDAGARPFLIVAVGASAGGLAPTQELLRELGPRPEVAVVVIHHLNPSLESGLIDILSRATRLPVLAASDGARAMSNHVYVIEPGTELLIRRGVLATVPRDEAARHLPVDRFFESLALDQAGLAVAVVLSGTGFDGAQGVKAIKSQGGIALAQDASALHTGMPESAIATGCVDAILPTVELARELVRLGRCAPSLLEPPASRSKEADYARVLAVVRKSSSVDFSSYKQTTIRRRLERRLVLHGLDELGPYVEMLARDPAEVTALCDELLVHVTSFFREPEAFDALTASVFPKLCDGRRRDTPIRVWVPGCSSGEEVYSIAMSLLEYLEQAQLQDQAVKIFGTDLSAAVIDRARVGRYPDSIAAEVAPARLVRFFTKDDRGYRIRQDVRDLCVFAKHDVTRDPPFSGIDLVSCRNLMIYLGAALQDRVVTLLHYALNEPGFLLLGGAETVRAFAGFVAVDGRNKIYARTSAAPRMAFDFTTARAPSELSAPTHSSMPSGTSGGARSTGPADMMRRAPSPT